MTDHGMHGGTEMAGRPLAKGLGLFSFVLGGMEVAMPGRLAAWLGMNGSEPLLRAYGLREIGAGAGTFAPDPRPAIWGRILGDFVDIGTLVMARQHDNPQRRNIDIALAAVAGVTALDLVCAALLQRGQHRTDDTQHRSAAGSTDFTTRSGWPNGRPRPLSAHTEVAGTA